MSRPRCGVWLGDQISSLLPCHWAAQFCGSSGACEMNGYEYAPSTTFEAPASAASGSPSRATVKPGFSFDSSSARFANPALLCDAVAPSFHFTTSFLRALSACHQLSATIATPPSRLVRSDPPSTTNACFTPGCALITSRFALATLPPNTGHFSKTAYSIPGMVKSIEKIGLPVAIAFTSTPGVGLPMIV